MKAFRKAQDLSTKTLLTIFLFLLAVVLFLAFGKGIRKTSAAWFDETWMYRTALTINNSGAAQSNKKVKFDIDTATLYTAGKIKINCDDSRFTDANGNLLDYYLDSANGACNTNSTDYWILVPTINSGATVIYHYYGNPSATKGSKNSQFSQDTFTPTSSSAASEEKSPGPVAYWKFDEGTGTTVHDSTSNGNNGTFGASTAAPTWQTEDMCVSGKCLKFDGGDYINIGDKLENLTGITINTWVKFNILPSSRGGTQEQNAMGIVSKFWDGTNRGYILYGDSGQDKIYFGLATDTNNAAVYAISDSAIQINKWYHIVASWGSQDSTLRLYIDGKLQNTTATISGNSTRANNSPLYVGKDYYNNTLSRNFNGFLDEVKIYPYARSAQQIRADYNSGSTRKGSSVEIRSKSAEILSNGLVGYWNFDNGSGTTAPDLSGNSNTATLGTAPANPGWVAGNYGIGLSFDGSNDYVTTPFGNGRNMVNEPMTVAMWVKPQVTNKIFISTENGTDQRFYLGIYSDKWEMGVQANGWGGGGAIDPVIYNQWHYIVAIADGSVVKLYVDNKFSFQKSYTSYTLPSNFAIGAHGPTSHDFNFSGLIDEVRIYNRALSPAEVRQLYEWAPGPVGYWNFEDGSGNTVLDRSGSGNNGSWSGTGTHWTTGKYGKAGKFNGSNDYVDAGNNSLLDMGTKNFTIETWVNTDTIANYDDILSKWQQDVGGYSLARVDSRSLLFSKDTSTYLYSASGALSVGKWTHIAYVKQGSTINCYINGIQSNGQTSGGGTYADIGTTNNNFKIGLGRYGIYSKGKIDDVRIYNYARSQKQIVEDMNARHPAPGSPVGSAIAHYEFDEGYGTTTHNSGSLGGLGTLGTGSSAPSWSNDGKFGKALNFDGSKTWVSFPDTSY